MSPVTTCLIALCIAFLSHAWTPIVVRNVTTLGPQLSPDVTNLSRDGGYSALINGNIVWLYDDTECTDLQGNQLSFISNTATYQLDRKNVSTVTDFGVVNLGTTPGGNPKTAILAGTTVGTGGWVPFQPDELDFNQQMVGKERVAIWPGTSPTPVSTTAAFIYAPLVYVDYKPQDPTKEYQARGMTLIAITAPSSGPVATRQGDLIIPGTEVAFGGFSTLLGYKSTDTASDNDDGDRDVYLVGMTNAGLQLARAGINDLTDFAKYTFWNPHGQNFSENSPIPSVDDTTQVYVPGSFSSGNIIYSPYFMTFIMIYFNKMVDSTFYSRYLNLNEPIGQDKTWVAGGKSGKGIVAEDVEALVKYRWSAEQKLWESPTGKGGFNYAGKRRNAHPEYFNTRYFPQSLYPRGTKPAQQRNPWYGGNLVAQKDAGSDGKNLMLSWTSQVTGGIDHGIYQIELAMLAFDNIPANPDATSSPSSSSAISSAVPNPSPPTQVKGQGSGPISVTSMLAVVEHGSAGPSLRMGSNRLLWYFFISMELLYLIERARRLI